MNENKNGNSAQAKGPTAERKAELVPMLNEKTIADSVLIKLNNLTASGALRLPANYSAENALRQAWLILQSAVDKDKQPVLKVCSKDSVALALLKMTLQGLDPAKSQCYFIAYGSALSCQRSYFGEIAVMKRVATILGEPVAQVVRQGEGFEYTIERGQYKILSHEPNIETADNEIIAAYAIIEYKRPDGKTAEWCEFMTRAQMESAWRKSRANPLEQVKSDDGLVWRLKANSTHGEFTDQMAKKTVLARAGKIIVNTSDDKHLYMGEFDADEIVSGVVIDARDDSDPLPDGSVAAADATKSDENTVTEGVVAAATEKPAQSENGERTYEPVKPAKQTEPSQEALEAQAGIPGMEPPKRRTRWNR